MNLLQLQQTLTDLQNSTDSQMDLRTRAIAAFQSYLAGTGIYTPNSELKTACGSFAQSIDLINTF